MTKKSRDDIPRDWMRDMRKRLVWALSIATSLVTASIITTIQL